MESTQDIKESSLASIHDAWATLQAHAQNGTPPIWVVLMDRFGQGEKRPAILPFP